MSLPCKFDLLVWLNLRTQEKLAETDLQYFFGTLKVWSSVVIGWGLEGHTRLIGHGAEAVEVENEGKYCPHQADHITAGTSLKLWGSYVNITVKSCTDYEHHLKVYAVLWVLISFLPDISLLKGTIHLKTMNPYSSSSLLLCKLVKLTVLFAFCAEHGKNAHAPTKRAWMEKLTSSFYSSAEECSVFVKSLSFMWRCNRIMISGKGHCWNFLFFYCTLSTSKYHFIELERELTHLQLISPKFSS